MTDRQRKSERRERKRERRQRNIDRQTDIDSKEDKAGDIER